MKRILLLSFLLCVIFFGCSRKIETADPNEEIIGSDSEIIMEPNPEESSVHEKEPESKYIVTELCPHIDIGHDGGTLFSGGKLWLSAIIYNSEDYDYSEKFIFSVDLDSGNIEEQTEAENEASDRFLMIITETFTALSPKIFLWKTAAIFPIITDIKSLLFTKTKPFRTY
ncbi:MAG: hypothetical protein IJA92_05095 [Oscillospiraceae bacterium]|nr:hypothetical protein [Oscillospiraceae bacterium]